MSLSKGIFIIGAKRTPFCGYGGPLREVQACHLFAAAAKDAIRTANIDPNNIDQTVIGNAFYLSQCDGGKTPRYCGIYSGVPIERPALGVSKACGTGIQAIITSAVDILFGTSNVCLTGGTEQMSTLPMLVRKVRFGTALGSSHQFEDHIQKEFHDSLTGKSLQRMAEETSKNYGIGRKNVDDYTLQSYGKWKEATKKKIFENELANVSVNIKKKDILVDKDLPFQQEINIDGLNQLPGLVDGGDVITSANSAPPSDGAAALILAGEEAVSSQNLKPLARLVGWTTVGVDPEDTAAGAIEAVKKLLNEHKLEINDVDLFEINEVFASQALITAMELKIDVGKLNVNGGALVLGHPVAATGARMVTHLVHELRRRNLKTAVAASSCGGGQGVAVLIQNVD